MAVSRGQKLVVLVGVLLIVATGAYPPWARVGTIDMGSQRPHYEVRQYIYGPLFRPPVAIGQIRETDPELGFMDNSADLLNWTLRLDTTRLLVQWGMICFAVAGTVLVLGRPRVR